MEFFKFIFSSFWVWLGTLLLLCALFGGVSDVVTKCKRNRKVTAWRIGERWHVQVDDASHNDLLTTLYLPRAAENAEKEKEGKNV